MTRRRLNPRLAKLHRSYTVEEVARLFGLHRNTVRAWIKAGLPLVDGSRPFLILGQDLSAFLHGRRVRRKRRCLPGEIYCVRCREPRTPLGAMADYVPSTDTLGNLVGICPVCETVMYRRVNPSALEQIRGELEVTVPKAARRIGDTTTAPENCDLGREDSNHEKAQCK